MAIHGYCDERFTRIRDEFEKNFSGRGDVGASFALTIDGEYAIDIWGGVADRESGRAWEEDTIVNVFSTTKTMAFLVCLMLADQGRLDLDAPVANYWPEFGQNGKQGIRVKHILSHSAGLPGFSRIFQPDELFNRALTIDDLASQAPWWEPGTASGYHAITQGQMLGEIVRRITGKSFGAYFKESVADPLDVDFHVGTPTSEFGRIARLIPATDPPAFKGAAPTSVAMRALSSARLPDGCFETEAWRRAELPAANGHGNARSVVRAQSVMANNGSAFGRQLLSPAGVAAALQEQTNGVDKVLMLPLRFGMGYALPAENLRMSPNANTLWWAGAGGSVVVIDMDARLCMAYVMNRMRNAIVGDERSGRLVAAVYDSLGPRAA